MLTSENILLFAVVIALSLVTVVIYDKLRPNQIVTREAYLEEKVKTLTAHLNAQQMTIAMLADRVWSFQKENDRLRAELTRQVPSGSWRIIDIADIARGLERLTVDEFRDMVHQSFSAVFDRISDTQSLQAQRLMLLDYADKHGEAEALRTAITAINPAAFW